MKMKIIALSILLSGTSAFALVYDCQMKATGNCGSLFSLSFPVNTEDPAFKRDCDVFGGRSLINGGIINACNQTQTEDVYPRFDYVFNVTANHKMEVKIRSTIDVVQPYAMHAAWTETSQAGTLGDASLTVSHSENRWGEVTATLTCVRLL